MDIPCPRHKSESGLEAARLGERSRMIPEAGVLVGWSAVGDDRGTAQAEG
jgi:hypothetical protein